MENPQRPPSVTLVYYQRDLARRQGRDIIRIEMNPNHWDDVLRWEGHQHVSIVPRTLFGYPVVLLDTVREPLVVAV